MKQRLLTFDDLYNFYLKYTKAKHFNCDEQGCEPIVVQTPATIKFEKSDIYEGLTAVRLQACHTEQNLNSSAISKEVMENKMLPTFKNRPILGYIHEVDGQPEFYGHNMHLVENEDGEEDIVYDEVPVGIIPESNEASLEYDEENKRYNVFVSGYLFDEYSKAVEILQREQELSVSVEISIKQMSYSPKDACLNIEDGYFSGVTILGVNNNGDIVKPGMAGSNIKLKDFSQSNNSMFANQTKETHQKLIETLDKLNETLTKFNINQVEFSANKISKEGGNIEVTKFEELLQKYNKTKTDIEFEIKGLSDEELEAKFAEVFGEESDKEDPTSEDGEGSVTENESTEEGTETEDCKNKEDESVEDKTVNESEDSSEKKNETDIKENESTEKTFETIEKSFQLSHDDIRTGLYALVRTYEELDNTYYGIIEVFDTYFIMCDYYSMNKYYGQKYVVENDTVAFDGERYELFAEFLTASEKAELESMRSNYSSIQTELNSYKESELNAQREAVFADENYAEFVETEGFKKIKENISTYSVEELRTACDLEFAKCVKAKGNFALKNEEEKPKASMFAFGKIEQKSSFLDGLLNKKETK